jgi:hypothetical protein
LDPMCNAGLGRGGPRCNVDEKGCSLHSHRRQIASRAAA